MNERINATPVQKQRSHIFLFRDILLVKVYEFSFKMLREFLEILGKPSEIPRNNYKSLTNCFNTFRLPYLLQCTKCLVDKKTYLIKMDFVSSAERQDLQENGMVR